MEKDQNDLYAALAEKYLAGTATQQEKEILHNWYDQWRDDEEEVTASADGEEGLRLAIWERIAQKLYPVPGRNAVYSRKIFRYTAAASVLLFSALGYFLWHSAAVTAKKQAMAQVKTPVEKPAISPGSDKAVLQLADGTLLNLDSTAKGRLAKQGNTSVVNMNGSIVYKAAASGREELLYNTVSTPRGGQYQLILPDGTKVWLNASSSIKFPVAFGGSTREVVLTGEGYFEVAKDAAKPFIAKTGDVEIRVLGTHFNINAYTEEGRIAATLLEGLINIKKAGDSHLIKPGQMAVYNGTGSFHLEDGVDAEEVIAWKNGKFHFFNADIKTVMRQLSRWYDIEVVYDGEGFDDRLGGIISRKENIGVLLSSLEKASELKFQMEGKKITVKR